MWARLPGRVLGGTEGSPVDGVQVPDCAFVAQSRGCKRQALPGGELEAGTPCGTLGSWGCGEAISLVPGQGSASSHSHRAHGLVLPSGFA